MARLSDERSRNGWAGLHGWQRDGEAIRRKFELDDFKGSWNKVTFAISTHSEGGLTENDFELARKVDRLA